MSAPSIGIDDDAAHLRLSVRAAGSVSHWSSQLRRQHRVHSLLATRSRLVMMIARSVSSISAALKSVKFIARYDVHVGSWG
eukprot:921088-Rhodomonas_salina.2